MPVIVGALGMSKKGTDKHINKIVGSHSWYEIQKIALCGTPYQFSRVQSIWPKNISQKTQEEA